MEPIIIKTGIAIKALLIFLILAGIGMSLLFCIVDHGHLVKLGLVFLVLPVMLIYGAYLSWYEFEFHESHIVFKRLNYRYEADYKYIEGIDEIFGGHEMVVHQGGSIEKIRFYIWPANYISFF